MSICARNAIGMTAHRNYALIVALLFSPTLLHAADEPPREWIEPATGHRVVRLSRENGTSSFYFHQNGYAGNKLVVSIRGGLATIDLATRNIDTILEGRAGQVIVGPKTRQVFYSREGALYSTHADTKTTRKIVQLPPEIRGGSGLALNADETLLAGSFVTRERSPATPRPQGRGRSLEERWAARLPMKLYTVDVKSGDVKTFHPDTNWLNHVQFSP